MKEYRHSAADSRKARRTRGGALAACAGLIAMLLAGPGFAQQPPANLVAPRVSQEEAVSIATRSRPGRVVRVVTVDEGRTHEVRILLDEGGRVVTVRVDAQTGRVR